jgi:hypothetical protein
MGKTKAPSQTIWPIVKSLINRDGPRAPTAGITFHTLEKANRIADCLGKEFTPHDLCDENYERHVEARVQTLLKAVENDIPP